jgi:uncharacterized membrane protein YdjX (TVP38/TMEM64 family)
MNTILEKARAIPRRTLVRGLLFLGFVTAALCLIRLTPLQTVLTPETLGRHLHRMGFWAPLGFVLLFATGASLLIPASLLTFLGAALFGTGWGFLYVWTGAVLSASASFLIGRGLARDFAAALMGDRLKKYDDAIARNGFTAVLYLRLIGIPFAPLNFGMGLTQVRFRDYFFGTCLGLVGGLFALTYFGGTVKEVWASGNWARLFSSRFFVAAGLLAALAATPVILKKTRKEK